jgi:hypothetical protein
MVMKKINNEWKKYEKTHYWRIKRVTPTEKRKEEGQDEPHYCQFTFMSMSDIELANFE